MTGPYAINGVPLKRVNPAYVIATSTRVSLDGVAANVDETHFKAQARFTKNQLKNASEARTKRAEAGKQAEATWREEAKKVQKTVDAKLVENIKKVEHLGGYLKTRFTLTSGVRPHELTFWFETYLNIRYLMFGMRQLRKAIYYKIKIRKKWYKYRVIKKIFMKEFSEIDND